MVTLHLGDTGAVASGRSRALPRTTRGYCGLAVLSVEEYSLMYSVTSPWKGSVSPRGAATSVKAAPHWSFAVSVYAISVGRKATALVDV